MPLSFAPPVDWRASPREERISAFPLRWVSETPDAPAIREGEELWTYGALGRAITEGEAWLEACGVRPGDRVMLVNENCRALAALIFAVAQCGAWAVIVNARLAAPEVEAILAHCEPRLVIYTGALSPEAKAHAARHGASPVEVGSLGELAVLSRPNVQPEPAFDDPAEQVAALIYTSGTTGSPKGVMLTHRNLMFVAATSGTLRGLHPGDRVYGVLPISHVFGLTSMFLASLRAGACLELVPRFQPAALAAALADGVTVFQGVPTMYARLLEHAALHDLKLDAPKLRYLSAGGSPLDLELKRRVEAALGVRLQNGYGLTECAPTVSQTLMDQPKDDTSTGPILPGIEVAFRHPASGASLAEGEVGELLVRGPNVMKGYYRNPEATREVLQPDGWLNTGDLARLDETGALHIVGRTRELIIRSGFNVYPPDVEAVIARHPDVTHCAVVGRRVADNEEVIAFVQLRPGCRTTAADLAAHAAAELAPYKRPSEIFIVEALPATPTGKVLKAKLRELAARPHGPSGTKG